MNERKFKGNLRRTEWKEVEILQHLVSRKQTI